MGHGLTGHREGGRKQPSSFDFMYQGYLEWPVGRRAGACRGRATEKRLEVMVEETRAIKERFATPRKTVILTEDKPGERIWGGSNLAAGSDSELGSSLSWQQIKEIADPIVRASHVRAYARV